ncbi:MAG: ECF-type sigma factor [Phycisphaerae bacterium]
MMEKVESFTRMLNAAAGGDARAASDLLPLIYDELRSIARARVGGGRAATTLQPTALVNEAYLRLFGGQTPTWSSRGHFFAAAAQTMRNILVDQARQKASLKRGGGRARVAEGEWTAAIEPPADDVLALDEALKELERSHPRKARLVMLHCFCGLSLEETAAALEVSLSTVEREWRFTRALLKARLCDEKNAGS